jgi:hypothetical protein
MSLQSIGSHGVLTPKKLADMFNALPATGRLKSFPLPPAFIQGEIRQRPSHSSILFLQLRAFYLARASVPQTSSSSGKGVCSLMPILRLTSPNWIPWSAFLKAKATCCSVKLGRLIDKIRLASLSSL